MNLNAVQVIRILGLLPLAMIPVACAAISYRRLPSPTRRRGHPIVYSDASILVIALLGRLWQLSTREVYLWLATWPVLAAAYGLPTGWVIDPGHFTRRVTKLGAYPFWPLYFALVWRGLRSGLLAGRAIVLDSSFLGFRGHRRASFDDRLAILFRFTSAVGALEGIALRVVPGDRDGARALGY